MKLKSLSVFFPCFNDEKSLPELLEKTYKTLPQITGEYEVIIVNDGSTDPCNFVLQKLSEKYSGLKVVNHRKNLGYGVVLKTGFENAHKEWVFYTDGDGQYDSRDLIKLVRKVSKDIDMVNGYKLQRGDSFYRTILGNIYNYILHKLYDLPIQDIDCDFRLIRRKYLRNLNLKSKSGLICLELILELKKRGARFSEIGVKHYPRKYGRSQFFKLRHIWPMIYENLKFLLDTSYGH